MLPHTTTNNKENFVLKRIFKFSTFQDTTGVILARSLSHVGQSHYGQ